MGAWGRVIAGVAGACLLALPASAGADTETFSYTGGAQTWTVPLGVHSATFDLYGGAGTNNGNSGQYEGLGGHATATCLLYTSDAADE